MSDLDLEAIRSRADAATAGPWSVELYEGVRDSRSRLMAKNERGFRTSLADYLTQADAEFIAHAREDVPALLHAADLLRSMLEGVQAMRPLSGTTDESPDVPESKRAGVEEVIEEMRSAAYQENYPAGSTE